MKVYIVQCHEDVSGSPDEVDVYKSLSDACRSYNTSVKTTAEIYGDDNFEDSLIGLKERRKLEGQDVNIEYEVPNGGCTHTINLYSMDI